MISYSKLDSYTNCSFDKNISNSVNTIPKNRFENKFNNFLRVNPSNDRFKSFSK